jgi:nucleoside-diphosphate-sugar epimerase
MSDLHVIFGGGPLGRSVIEAALQKGYRVRVVTRSGVMQQVPQGVELVSGDCLDVDAVRRLTEGAAAVYQCAQPEYHEWPEKFPPLQAAILEGVAASGAKLVIGENLYLYGDTNGKPLTEDLPYAADTRKGKTRAEMAQAALVAHRSGKVRVAIGRGSDFFGPYTLGSALGDRAIYPALAGKSASLGGKLDIPHTFTFIEDFGRALVILAERDEALGQAWHVPNDQPSITQRQIMTLFFEEIGLPPKMSGVSKNMMRLAGLFVPGAREMVEMMYEFEKPFVVDSSKFERAFGMPATPLRTAVRKTVEWFRMNPKTSQESASPGDLGPANSPKSRESLEVV